MAGAATTVTLDEIRQVVHQIVGYCHPQRVVVFGSYADGTPTPDSDVDLLVVMDTEEPPLHAAARIAAAVDHPFPLDILVVRPEALMDALARKASFATAVMTKGTVLYEARDGRVD